MLLPVDNHYERQPLAATAAQNKYRGGDRQRLEVPLSDGDRKRLITSSKNQLILQPLLAVLVQRYRCIATVCYKSLFYSNFVLQQSTVPIDISCKRSPDPKQRRATRRR